MRSISKVILTTLAGLVFAVPISAQEMATLYAPKSYNGDHGRAYFDFQTGQLAKRGAHWNLAYGLLRAGEDFDWFQSKAALDDRSLIKDLGKLTWTDHFEVPLIEPLPKLKAGELRTINIDLSGANGANGANGSSGAAGAPGRRGEDGGARQTSASLPNYDAGTPPPRDPFPTGESPRPPKRKPKIDPIFVKAIVGHIYAIRVVNDHQDFYALFRVESLTRGDNVTISWRLAPSPVSGTVYEKK